MIKYELYTNDLSNIEIADGFFEGWHKKPNKIIHRKILENSYKSIVAMNKNTIIGFINIISDGILSAYIPLLEVIPEYRNRGIGRKLIKKALDEVKDLYMIDLSCDDNLVEFYKKIGMHKSNAMFIRNYE